MKTVYDPAVGAMPLELIQFDEIVASRRLTGQVMVTSYRVVGSVGDLTTVDIEATTVGPFLIEPLTSDVPALAARRAIDLDGLGLRGEAKA